AGAFGGITGDRGCAAEAFVVGMRHHHHQALPVTRHREQSRCPDDNVRVPRPRQPARARREVSAGGVVFRRTAAGPQVALIKANGRWSFPKGNIEKDETPEATDRKSTRLNSSHVAIS